MPRPIPESLAQALGAPAPKPSPEEVARVLGGIGLPGESLVPRLGKSNHLGEGAASSAFQETLNQAREHTSGLLVVTKPDLVVPELTSPELAHVDWKKLEAGYEAQSSLGLEPEVVISPEGRELAFWRSLYSNLRQWQDENAPTNPNRLKKQGNGDGLYVDNDIDTHWSELTDPTQPRWSVSVIPGVIKAPVLGVDHSGKLADGSMPDRLTQILNALPDQNLQHPSLERYLTKQALRFIRELQPIDDNDGELYYYSWLDGSFKNSNNDLAAPVGFWYRGNGQVGLVWYGVGFRYEYLGARSEVRG